MAHRVNHLLTMQARAVAPQCRPSYARCGDCGSLPHYSDGLTMRHVILIAAAGASLAGCSSLSLDAFKSTPPTVQLQLELGTDGRGSPDLAGTELQDALLRGRAQSRNRVLGHLHTEQVPAGNDPGAGNPQSRRLDDPCFGDDRSQSGGRGTAAGRAATQGRPEEDAEAENAQAAERHYRPRGGGIALPRIRRRPHPAADCSFCLHCTKRGADCGRMPTCIDYNYETARHALMVTAAVTRPIE